MDRADLIRPIGPAMVAVAVRKQQGHEESDALRSAVDNARQKGGTATAGRAVGRRHLPLRRALEKNSHVRGFRQHAAAEKKRLDAVRPFQAKTPGKAHGPDHNERLE
jgi:hypothetical protein